MDDQPPQMEERGNDAFVAEFVGTFLLVFFIVAILSVEHGLGYADFAVIGLIHWLALAVIVYSFGGVSGAHANPAVTVALAVVRRISVPNAVTYVVFQLAGGLAGALVGKLIFLTPGRAANYGAAALNRAGLHATPLRGLLAEAIGGFILVLAVMATAIDPRGSKPAAGIVIGAGLALPVMAFGPLTGAGINPARWFGPAIVASKFSDFWLYIVGPVAGGVLAALLYDAMVLRRTPHTSG